METKTTIISRKFDNSIHKSWSCSLVKKTQSLLVFKGIFENDLNHSKLGFIKRGTISFEYYWLNRWYNVFRFHETSGELRNYYCNINFPPKFTNSVLDYIDLDIDIVIWKDFNYEILDLDEFEENSKKYKYSLDLKLRVQNTLKELIEEINQRKFPFNYDF